MIGQTLAHFRIIDKLGEGGMGTVYLAEDTKLGRQVAIKVLPEAFTADAERLARFEREAKVLAALNHPNIAGIYEVGVAEVGEGLRPLPDESDSDTGRARRAAPTTGAEGSAVHYLVMELAEGEDLADRMERGSIPVDLAIPIAVEIAEALEAAHAAGVIHRDLKPANVKLIPDGPSSVKVKVLDFGLAKAWDPPSESSPELSLSPTLTAQMTQAGVILGTAAYMSPEQARGENVDQRADVWAFGVLLYEMLSGERLFREPTVSDTLAAVLRADFDWDKLPDDTPWRVTDLLKRCLDRDPRNRLHAIADARIELVGALDESTAPMQTAASTPAGGTRRLAPLPWALALVLGTLLGLNWIRPDTSPPSIAERPILLEINLPSGVRFDQFNNSLALSPDGRFLVLGAYNGAERQLYLRDLASSRFEAIAGTEGGVNPFFSPDGRWLGFSVVNDLKKVSLDTSTVLPIATAEWGGGVWGPDDLIIYSPSYLDGLWRVPADGGDPERLTTPDPERGELGHFWPHLLPDPQTVLFTNFKPPLSETRIEVLDLETLERRVLLEDAAHGRYFAAAGQLLFVRREALFAAPFDTVSLEITGPATPLLDDVYLNEFQGNAAMEISTDGTMVVIPASEMFPDRWLVWVDRNGKEELALDEARRFLDLDISPDGNRVSVTIRGDSQDLWIVDLERDSLSRLTHEAATEFNGKWTPDGEQILFNIDTPPFDQFRTPADGSGQRQPFLVNELDATLSDISADGQVAYWQVDRQTNRDIWLTSLEPGTEPRLFYRTPFLEQHPAFSPDGRWIAYQSDESGQVEVYVQAIEGGGAKHKVSVRGGTRPLWSHDGNELFYRLGDQMWAVKLSTEPRFRAERPEFLFEATYLTSDNHRGYDIGDDGRFLFIKGEPGSEPRTVTVMLNVGAEIARRTAGSD